jgi:hypothetical protein
VPLVHFVALPKRSPNPPNTLLPVPPPSPKKVVVLMMSVCFIAFVTMLHAVSKIYQYTSK